MHRHLFQRSRLRCFSTENDFNAAKEAINAIQPHPTEEAAHHHATQGLHRVQSGHIQEGISLFQKGLDILSSSPTTPTAPTAETFTASPTARHLHNCLGLAKQTQSEFIAAETSLQNAFELCNDPALLGLGDDQFIDRTGVLMDLAANLQHYNSTTALQHYGTTVQYHNTPKKFTYLAIIDLMWHHNETAIYKTMLIGKDNMAQKPR